MRQLICNSGGQHALVAIGLKLQHSAALPPEQAGLVMDASCLERLLPEQVDLGTDDDIS